MTDSGSSLLDGLAKVTTAGTRVQLVSSGSSFAAKAIIVQALSENEEPVVVGGKEVVAAKGSHASPTQKGIELAAKQVISIDINDATQVWVDSRKNGDGVSYLVLLA